MLSGLPHLHNSVGKECEPVISLHMSEPMSVSWGLYVPLPQLSSKLFSKGVLMTLACEGVGELGPSSFLPFQLIVLHDSPSSILHQSSGTTAHLIDSFNDDIESQANIMSEWS